MLEEISIEEVSIYSDFLIEAIQSGEMATHILDCTNIKVLQDNPSEWIEGKWPEDTLIKYLCGRPDVFKDNRVRKSSIILNNDCKNCLILFLKEKPDLIKRILA